MKPLNVVGKSILRTDAYIKVTGAAQYVGDIRRRGMLHAKILRSPHAHANIVNIDTSRAEALAGVRAVVTWQNVPQIPFTSCGHPYPPDTPEDTLILSRRLRYVGDPVAAVAAETVEIAQAALALINVEYEILPAYFTPEEALQTGAMELHDGLRNICGENEYRIGDTDAAMAAAKYIVEDEFFTPIVTHSPIEPHISMTELDNAGRLVIHVANQMPSVMRQRIAYALGLRIGQVRVVMSCIGGGFGGKQEPVYEPLNAVLTLKTKAPVRLELTREECIAFTRTRHSAHFTLKTGLAADGKILAREIRVIQNTGAYASHGHNVVYNIATQFALLYPTPNLHFFGQTVYTNILIAGAFRGYGIPQYAFAMESHVDHLAQVLGRDPLEYRRQIMMKPGDPINAEFVTLGSYGLDEVIKVCEKAIGYDAFRKEPKSEGTIKRGIGVALCSYNQSTFPHGVELSGAHIMMNEDASAVVFVNSAEIGQGSDTTMKQIAAEALGIPCEWITVISGDTDLCPFDSGAFASRQTYVTGQAVKIAALKCKDQILEHAAKEFGIERGMLDTDNGMIINVGSGETLASMESVTMKMVYSLTAPVTVGYEASFTPTVNLPSFGASFAIVEVDTGTGKVEVKKMVSAMDSGRLINPLAAMGQLNGGNIMSMGFGLSEQVLLDPKTGRVYNDNLLDYKIPTFADVPDMEGYFVETEEASSAYGNKSLGEPPNITPAVAIRNAVLDATGIRINTGPLTPERVLTHLLAAKNEAAKSKKDGCPCTP